MASASSIPLIQAQLDHTSDQSPSLVLIQDSVRLSASLLLREILIRTLQRNHQAILCSTLRDPKVYLPPSRGGRDERLQILDAHLCVEGYDEDLEEEEEQRRSALNPAMENPSSSTKKASGSKRVWSMKELMFRVRERARKAGPSARLTVVIDSLDALLEQYDSSPSRSYSAVYEFIKSILSTLNPHSRLIIVHPLDSRSLQAKSLFSSLLSPLIFSSSSSPSIEEGSKSSSSGLTSILRLHSPALPRLLLADFGLLPPSTSDSMLDSIKNERQARSREEAKRLELGSRNGTLSNRKDEDKKKKRNLASKHDSGHDEGSDVDPRFWDVLNNVASREDVHFTSSGSGFKNSDFEIEEAFSSLESSNSKARGSASASSSSSSSGTVSSVTFDRLKTSSRTDEDSRKHSRWAMIETRSRNRTGKWSEEILGLVRNEDEVEGGARLSVVGLDMTRNEVNTRRLPWEDKIVRSQSQSHFQGQVSAQGQAHDQTGRHQNIIQQPSVISKSSDQEGVDPHAKLVENLPFNLSETSSQRARRDDVPLPYTFYKQTENHVSNSNDQPKKGNILFEPESEDDEDEDDPDDDLDL